MLIPGSTVAAWQIALLCISIFPIRQTIPIGPQQTMKFYIGCATSVTIAKDGSSKLVLNYRSNDAEILPGELPSEILIVPKAKNFKLEAFKGEELFNETTYEARAVPMPIFLVRHGEIEVFPRDGVNLKDIADLHIHADPDPNFQQAVPRDARFRIKKAEITLSRQTLAIEIIKVSEETNLSTLAKSAKSGDRLVIHFQEVVRINFKGEEVSMPLKSSFLILQVN